ncbi:MAG TPA: hypothetical protein PK867_11210 [Pirellulales bacterium]|nr:hypothetical protein [Pirellulales bacterium]
MRNAFYYAAAALALCGASCRNNEHHIYPVSGKAMYKGAPAAGAAVFFNRQGRDLKEQLVMGIVKDDGSFELVCGPWGKGAAPGDYDVTVEWRAVVAQQNGNPQRGPDKLNGRYADATHPLLHATVGPKANVLAPFELTD